MHQNRIGDGSRLIVCTRFLRLTWLQRNEVATKEVKNRRQEQLPSIRAVGETLAIRELRMVAKSANGRTFGRVPALGLGKRKRPT